MKHTYIVFDKTESVWNSIRKDTFTFSCLLLCIYCSQGSRAWTFVTGGMFLLALFGTTAYVQQSRHKKFKTAAELIEWAKTEAGNEP